MLGNNPGCLVHYGALLLGALVLILIALSGFISYPDTVTAPVVLSSANPPVRVLAPVPGRLTILPVQNGDSIRIGQVLAEIESSTLSKDVRLLEDYLNCLESQTRWQQVQECHLPRNLHLGALQNTFGNLTNLVQFLKVQILQDGIFRQISAIDQEIRGTNALIASLEKQAALLAEDFALTEKDFKRQQQLFDSALISAQELEKYNSNYLRQKQQLEQFTSNISNNQVKIRQLEVQQIQLGQAREQTVLNRWEEIRQTTRQLRSEIEQWKLNYLITATVSGRLAYSIPLVVNQYLKAEQELFSIQVAKDTVSSPLALAQLPQAGSGKVGVGQSVKIRLDAFPFQQFGVLEGQVQSISLIPANGTYLVYIRLPQDLITSAKKTITFKPESTGMCTIVTKKRTLLQRIFDRIFSLNT